MTLLRMFRGDDKQIQLNVVDTDGDPLDLSIYDLEFEVKARDWQSPTIFKDSDSGITLGGETGSAVVQIDSTDTIGLSVPCKLSFRLRIIDEDGERTTVSDGRLEVI